MELMSLWISEYNGFAFALDEYCCYLIIPGDLYLFNFATEIST
jgi:hypothetical protein